eukprot:4495433-Pleurochrysis_carterae.AAC.2
MTVSADTHEGPALFVARRRLWPLVLISGGNSFPRPVTSTRKLAWRLQRAVGGGDEDRCLALSGFWALHAAPTSQR